MDEQTRHTQEPSPIYTRLPGVSSEPVNQSLGQEWCDHRSLLILSIHRQDGRQRTSRFAQSQARAVKGTILTTPPTPAPEAANHPRRDCRPQGQITWTHTHSNPCIHLYACGCVRVWVCTWGLIDCNSFLSFMKWFVVRSVCYCID